jgi:hypothetical protein
MILAIAQGKAIRLPLQLKCHHEHLQLTRYGTNILAARASTAVQQLKTYFSLFCSPGEQIRMEVAKFVLF